MRAISQEFLALSIDGSHQNLYFRYSVPIGHFKNYLKGLQKDFGATYTYLRLALEGNRVERVTDFAQCKHPVLLIYGFGATRRIFGILEKRLRRDGFCVFSLNLGGLFETFNTRCIEELALHVHEKVERLCEKHKLGKISIVGHSKGGLIGRYYVKRLGGSHRVKALITLGTPHHGNHWAFLGAFSPLGLFSKSVWQMVPMSGFIRNLKKGPWPKSVKLTSIFSRDDKICFYKSSMLDIPANCNYIKNIELEGLSHSDYIIRKSAYDVIKKELLAVEK